MAYEQTVQPNGAAIRAFRKKERLSVAQVAGFVGLAPQSLTNIESGGRGTTPEVMRNLARVLGVPVEAITRDGSGASISPGPPGADDEEALLEKAS
jgi:transcriptional regulator with XRE-family HTH domain